MDRELVLTLLVLLVVGSTCFVVGATCGAPAPLRSGRATERVCWRRLWLPFVPASLALAALVGWALQEPDDSERLPLAMVVPACFFGIVWARAALRAIWARSAGGHVRLGTRGLLRPTVVVDRGLRSELDAAAFDAALAHERAHAAHRDPLRIWCAQLASDLQWPAPGARARLAAWLHALELARDEEAREAGADGADLAAAILHVARDRAERLGAVAALTGSDALRDRITRLLEPLRAAPPRGAATVAFAAWALGGTVAAIAGDTFGEYVIRAVTGLQ